MDMTHEKMRTEIEKMIVEMQKMNAETQKINAETRKLDKEVLFYPFVVAIGLVGASAAVVKLFF